MKVASFVLALMASSAQGFAFVRSGGARSMTKQTSPTAIFGSVGIYYSSSTGNTETVAGYISEAAGGVTMDDIGDASKAELEGHDSLIVSAPTWHTGADEQRSGTSWDEFLYDTFPGIELKGKKVAVFRCGEQESYGDYYCDAAGEIYNKFREKGCNMFGMTSTDGYIHEASKAEIDGKFCGLMFDEDNQYDLSEDRSKY